VANLSAPAITFAAPGEPVTFQVTATGRNGTATDTVTVTPAEQLTVGSAELRTRDRQWRVSGTSSDTTLNTVEVYLATTTGTKGALVGSAAVDATGAWTVVAPNGVSPGSAFTRVIAESSNGTVTAPFAYTTRR